MARIRTLKPEFFLSETVGSVSLGARLLFAGLWTVADREGRLRWQPRKLKAQIFPYDDALELHRLAEDLARVKLLVFYEDDGGVYAWLPGFSEHQRPHPKEPESVLPPYPSGMLPGWLPWKKTASSRELPGSIPSSPGGREGKGTDQEGKGTDQEGGGYRASAPLVMSPLAWDRKHGAHLAGFCDWVCLPEDLANQFAARAGWPDTSAVAGWATRVRQEWQQAGRVPTERMYDFWNARWSESFPAPSQNPVEAFMARQRQRAKAAGGQT